MRILARMASKDPRSTTCKNIRYLRQVTQLENVEEYCAWRVKAALPVQKVPERELWRLGLLSNLMNLRSERNLAVQDSKKICGMIDSLCST